MPVKDSEEVTLAAGWQLDLYADVSIFLVGTPALHATEAPY